MIIALALGGQALVASIIHLIGHSLIKASFFLTSGNVLELFSTKKIKSVTGLLKVDGKTGWLWILSLIGITAIPPSILFISEFLIIKTMFVQKKFLLCVLFLLLLTIILYGMAKSVIRMCYSPISEEKLIEVEKVRKTFDWRNYSPQFVLIIIALILGVYIPPFINNLINGTIIGF